ncbi:MAG: site-specific integrase [Phycisphaerales bacterium]
MQTRPMTNPKYRRHAASGQARVTIAGRDYYLGRFDSPESHARYHGLIAEWLASRKAPATVDRRIADATTPRVATILHAFHEWGAKRYERSREFEKYAPVIKALRLGWGELPVDQFGPRQLKRYRDQLVARGDARGYVNQSVRRAAAIFRWAVSEELAPPSVAVALATVRGLRVGESAAPETPPVRPVPLEVVEATLRHLPPTTAAVVRVMLLTGARPSEICAMRPCDIDRSGRVWLYTPKAHKLQWHGKGRVIPLIAAAQDVVRPFLVRPAESFCFSPSEAVKAHRQRRSAERKTPEGRGNGVGSNRKANPRKQAGTIYTADSLRRAVEYACLRAFPAPPDIVDVDAWRRDKPDEARAWDKSKRWNPYRLRHLCATLTRRVSGLDAARVTLGHSTAAITATIYAEATAEAAAEHLEATWKRYKIA